MVNIPHWTQSKSLDHLEHSWQDRCPPSSAHWDHPGPPPWFPEDELQPSWLPSLMAAGKRLSTEFLLPFASPVFSPSLGVCYWPFPRREGEEETTASTFLRVKLWKEVWRESRLWGWGFSGNATGLSVSVTNFHRLSASLFLERLEVLWGAEVWRVGHCWPHLPHRAVVRNNEDNYAWHKADVPTLQFLSETLNWFPSSAQVLAAVAHSWIDVGWLTDFSCMKTGGMACGQPHHVWTVPGLYLQLTFLLSTILKRAGHFTVSREGEMTDL